MATPSEGKPAEVAATDAVVAARVVVLARVRKVIDDIRITKRSDCTYTPEMKDGMEDALNNVLQGLVEFSL